tara:strand:- start:475 stop:669 length:195 start_codon:yes stop_codon:yes gene_type:complete
MKTDKKLGLLQVQIWDELNKYILNKDGKLGDHRHAGDLEPVTGYDLGRLTLARELFQKLARFDK